MNTWALIVCLLSNASQPLCFYKVHILQAATQTATRSAKPGVYRMPDLELLPCEHADTAQRPAHSVREPMDDGTVDGDYFTRLQIQNPAPREGDRLDLQC